MPISFQPAQPVSTDISASYGAGEQAIKDMPAVTSAYEAAAQNALGWAHLNAQRQAAAGQSANQASALALQDRHLQLQQDAQTQQTALGYAQLQQKSADIDQKAQADAWVKQRDITFQDQQRLQQLNSAVSEVQQAHQSGKLDDDTYTAAILRLKAHIDPIELKHQTSLAKYRTAQTNDLTEQAKLRAALSNTDAAVRAQAANQLTFNLTNPATGKMFTDANGDPVAYHLDQHGKPVPVETGGKGAAADKSAAARAELAQLKADQHEDDQFRKDYATELARLNKAKHEKLVAVATKGKDPYPEWDPSNVEGNAAQTMRESPKWGAGTVEELRQRREERRRAAKDSAGHAGGGGDWSGGQNGGPPPANQPPPPARPTLAEARRVQPPMDVADPQKWTPEQRQQIDDLQQLGRLAMGVPGLNEEQRRMYHRQFHFAMDLLHQSGSVDGMTEPDRDHYRRLVESLSALEKLGKPPQQQQQPKRKAGFNLLPEGYEFPSEGMPLG